MKGRIAAWVKENMILHTSIGDIELQEQIGQGGTSLIFSSPFAGGAAVKFLAEDVSSSRSTRYRRFLGEYVHLVGLVATGAIVPQYHFGVQKIGDRSVPYIVMELCEETLDDRYETTSLEDPDEFERLLQRLLTLLDTIHTSGIVHRDIKPKNILLRLNGDWVLGDFGISWFDPEFYKKLAKTDKAERLANWQFSPEEQFRRDGYEQAKPRLDLYALGQTLYYCVTGHTIRGSRYPRFARIAPSLAEYDPLIAGLVRQKPEERFQTVKQTREFLSRQRDEGEQKDTLQPRALEMERQVDEFDHRLARAMPGSNAVSYAQASSRKEIDRVLSSLAEDPAKYSLWWSQGDSHNRVRRMEQMSEEIWLLNIMECHVVDLWIHRTLRLQRSYVLLQLAPMPRFEIYDSDAQYTREAGYFQGHYIPRAELDDGYAQIDGEIVCLEGAEVRMRNFEVDFLFLGPQLGVCFQFEADETVRQVYLSLCEAGEVDPELLEPLETIRRAPWMSTYD